VRVMISVNSSDIKNVYLVFHYPNNIIGVLAHFLTLDLNYILMDLKRYYTKVLVSPDVLQKMTSRAV